MFVLRHEGSLLEASGIARSLRFRGTGSVERQVRAFFAAQDAGVQGLLVGVLPFDLDGEVILSQPEQVYHGGPAWPVREAPPEAVKPRRITEVPTAAAYAAMVRDALALIAAAPQDGLRKVVLSRSLRMEMDAPVDPLLIAQRLSIDPSITVFLASLGGEGEGKAIVGATPELLLSRRGLAIASHPLAGSAARSADPAEDRAAADALLRSDKDRREHKLLAEAVLDTLAPYCASLSAPDGIALRATATVWHLGTRIEGVLKSVDAPSAAGLAALLHPTPAVGGHPRTEALAAIRALEPHERGYYAGAVGWVDGRGDGEWYVSLRCAEIAGEEVVLQAGAGIVAGSDPDAEVAETAAKFRAMLAALGLDNGGHFLEEAA